MQVFHCCCRYVSWINRICYSEKKKNMGTIGTQPPNPLSPEGKKKFALYFGVTIALLIVLFYALITIGWLTIDRFVLLVTILAVIIPVVAFFRYKSSLKQLQKNSQDYLPIFPYSCQQLSSGLFMNKALIY